MYQRHMESKIKNLTSERPGRGFTLVEMLTVIGIIVLLVSILLPVVSAVRIKGHQADTNALLARIGAGAEAYYADFKAYPGPLHNSQIYNGGAPTFSIANVSGAKIDTTKITEAENFVLGLLGGLYYDNTGKLTFDINKVGNGPVSLNTANPKKYHAYMNKESLSAGDYKDDAGDADDSEIPEFLDKFPDPMPILVLRANVGAPGICSKDQPITKQEQYDLKQIEAYTLSLPGKTIGVGREAPSDSDFAPSAPATPADKLKHGLRDVHTDASIQNPPPTGSPTQKYYYPYDLYGFLRHPSMTNTPRQKDGYVLISAGADRIYGTKDDVVYPASR